MDNADELFSKALELQYPVLGPRKIMACRDFAHLRSLKGERVRLPAEIMFICMDKNIFVYVRFLKASW